MPPEHAHSGDAQKMTGSVESLLLRIREQARAHFSQAKGSHDWDHTLRVHRLCRRIAAAEGADLLVTEAAAYLHDIGREHQDRANGRLCHAEKGAAMAREMLSACPLSDERRENIIAGIHESIGSRVIAMASRVGITEPLMMTGGVAKNIGVVRALEKKSGKSIRVSAHAQVNGAIGAALIAAAHA